METLVTTDFEKCPDNSTPAGIKNGFNNHEEDITCMGKRQMDANSFSGVKRPRIDVEERQPSVHIVYNFLPRESQLKLEELLQMWSRWHSQSCSASSDSNMTLESGEKTYFPALRVGTDKPSDVTFWMDNQTRIESSKEFVQLDSMSVPLYDRGYSLALASADESSKLDGVAEKLDSSRCFNCGSYSHSLKDCRKPRDNVAVNNARKQHKSTRNQRVNSRNSIRYYQSSRGGKYDGLVPGILDSDTRHALGLGDLDPPPWLNRMREIGYPPGYFDSVDDQPSGITIFGENDGNEKEGVILDRNLAKPSRKMTIEFPGINGPIPESADERLWAPPASKFHQPKESSYRSSENQSRWLYNHSLESQSRWRHPERRWFNELEDDGPPGCDHRDSPSLLNHCRRYGENEYSDYSRSPRSSPSARWSSSYGRYSWDNGIVRSPTSDHRPRYGDYDNRASPSYGRSYLDRDRRSYQVHDDSLYNGSYDGYRTFPYSSPR